MTVEATTRVSSDGRRELRDLPQGPSGHVTIRGDRATRVFKNIADF
jgi:hypothetical protein